LVPFAGAADNHQEHNARAALDAGAAWMLREDQLDGGEVERRLQALLDDPAPLAEVSRAAKRLAKPDAAQEIARALLGMAQGTHP
jgi:UDP-N-acetylglucosamine--N-acetylmuramyl-(pentapeptide) pyrophosphoryl-undecaprenol N-acetylglucosamine transferase